MNSLPLSHVVISLAHEILLGKLLLTNPAKHCSAKLAPRPFRAQAKNLLVCIKFDKGGNSLPKYIRSNL